MEEQAFALLQSDVLYGQALLCLQHTRTSSEYHTSNEVRGVFNACISSRSDRPVRIPRIHTMSHALNRLHEHSLVDMKWEQKTEGKVGRRRTFRINAFGRKMLETHLQEPALSSDVLICCRRHKDAYLTPREIHDIHLRELRRPVTQALYVFHVILEQLWVGGLLDCRWVAKPDDTKREKVYRINQQGIEAIEREPR